MEECQTEIGSLFLHQNKTENHELFIALMIGANVFVLVVFDFLEKASFFRTHSVCHAFRLPQIWLWHFIFMAHIFGSAHSFSSSLNIW